MRLALAPAAAAALERYLDELRNAAERVNLVGSTDAQALERHVSDALEPASALPAGANVVDLGSGAGFPGIPIALARPDLAITLVEIRERRVHFLRHVVRTLGLAARVVRARIEEPFEAFDVALLRAVAPPDRALTLARPWTPEGAVWIWVGAAAVDPAPGAEPPIPLESGGRVLRIRAAAVPRGTPNRA